MKTKHQLPESDIVEETIYEQNEEIRKSATNPKKKVYAKEVHIETVKQLVTTLGIKSGFVPHAFKTIPQNAEGLLTEYLNRYSPFPIRAYGTRSSRILTLEDVECPDRQQIIQLPIHNLDEFYTKFKKLIKSGLTDRATEELIDFLLAVFVKRRAKKKHKKRLINPEQRE